ncbi:MAG: VOC family protein [Candidatus Nanopelagicales bacterium]
MAHLAITLDCHDPQALASFWSAALGYRVVGGMGQYVALVPGDDHRFGAGPRLLLQQVPEPKTGKNRLHLDLDLDPGEPLEPEVARLVALGAVEGPVTEEFGLRWSTLADPEGNEFCVVSRP